MGTFHPVFATVVDFLQAISDQCLAVRYCGPYCGWQLWEIVWLYLVLTMLLFSMYFHQVNVADICSLNVFAVA